MFLLIEHSEPCRELYRRVCRIEHAARYQCRLGVSDPIFCEVGNRLFHGVLLILKLFHIHAKWLRKRHVGFITTRFFLFYFVVVVVCLFVYFSASCTIENDDRSNLRCQM